MKNLLQVNQLSKSFDENKVLNEISFEVKTGEVLCILGPNGAGKTTTINILTAALGSDGGEVLYKGTPIGRKLRAYKQDLGIVPQDVALYEQLSAEQNLRFFASLYGLKGKQLNEAVDQALSFAGLADRRQDKVKTFLGWHETPAQYCLCHRSSS
jgi:ABC-type multidrug transport system, ATPase component